MNLRWPRQFARSRGPGGMGVGVGLDPTLGALRSAAADAQKSRLPQMAAALSYRTTFGLLPVIAIGLWVLHRVLSEADLANLIDKGIALLGLKSIVVDQSAADQAVQGEASWFAGPMLPGAAPPPTTELDNVTVVASGQLQTLEQWVKAFVDRINTISFQAIGLVGLIMLIYAAIAMVVEVERAFNQIYRVPRGRSWARRVTIYWTLLTLGPLCLFGTFFIGARLNDWVATLTGRGIASDMLATGLTALGLASQFIISTLLLVVIYQVVPNTKVRLWPALTGAAVAAGLFEATKFGFAAYVRFSAGASFGKLYGSLALIPLFLLWVYVIWLIVLFGLQLTYQLHHGRFRTRAQPINDFGPAMVEPTSALTVMQVIARAFGEGRTPDAPTIAQRSRVAEPVVRTVLARAVERALLHRIEPPDAAGNQSLEPTYTLARPAAAIRVADLLTLGFELAGADAPDDPVIARLHEAQIRAAADDTLADIAPATPATPAPESDTGGLARGLFRPAPAERPGGASNGLHSGTSGSTAGPRGTDSPRPE